MYLEVQIAITAEAVDKPFHYAVPAGLAGKIQPGMRVLVPFGSRQETAFVLGYTAEADVINVKEIIKPLDEFPLLSPELLQLSAWIARYYMCTRAAVLQAMLPFSPGTKRKKYLFVSPAAAEAEITACLPLLQKKAPRQARALMYVFARKRIFLSQLIKETAVDNKTIEALVKKNLVVVNEKTAGEKPAAGKEIVESSFSLTSEQQKAFFEIEKSLAAGRGQKFLLHGVTGSGKTELYIRTIKKVLAKGKGAIVTVPEIALTPLMIESFKKHFGSRVAMLHSRLSQGERYEEWCRLITGEATIAVGARSAVFAPIKDLGIIIIDEEHERTYKQEETPRYHTHEVAAERCRFYNAHLLLGSATPSLETYREALLGDCRLLQLTSRIGGKAMPAVDIVDMRRELKEGNRSMFSRSLYHGLQETMAQGNKAIIFLNRRGHSTCVLCRECGHVMRCPFCDISLTYHSSGEKLICHYCYYVVDVPDLCPSCKSVYIKYFGTGTQKVEEELLKFFPDVKVLRMDTDTTSRKDSHRKILTSFQKEGSAILVGTQMIAKGLDIPGVTLVGVIAADVGLNLPDFRAAERTFQLLTQVSGRAGRGKEQGQVIIQTYAPEHYSIIKAKSHDFKGFYAQEIQFREELNYPPFCSLLRIVLTGRNEEVLKLAALQLNDNKERYLTDGLEALGPVPCPINRKNSYYRWHMVFRGTDKELLREKGIICRDYIRDKFKDVTVTLDFEPYSML